MAEKNNSNMVIYEAHRKPPKEALKPINAGRLKGMTDINPMWRIKALTEQFGACGIGWYYTVDEQRVEDCGNEKVAIVNISLFVKDGNEWSKPIHGTGGSKLIAMESKGAFVSDEAFKMATTDALSVACKQLGFAADIYWQTDRDKYTANDVVETKETSAKIRKDTPEEAKANEEMRSNVDDRLLPNPNRSPEEREKNIKDELERTGQDEKKLLDNAGVKAWSELTDAKYVSLMEWLVKRPDKK